MSGLPFSWVGWLGLGIFEAALVIGIVAMAIESLGILWASPAFGAVGAGLFVWDCWKRRGCA